MRAVFTCKPRNSSVRARTDLVIDHDLVRVDTEAEGVQQIDRNLRVANRLGLVARHRIDIVDVHNTAARDCRLRKLGRNSRYSSEAEGQRHALVLHTVEHGTEESLAGLADWQVHVEFRKVDLREVVAATEDRLKGYACPPC